MHPLPRVLKKFLKILSGRTADYFFPPLCLLCDSPRSENEPWLCETCINELRENHFRRDACPVCAMNRTRGDCACAKGWDQPFESIHALLDYDSTVQACMHQIKYNGKKRFARHLGRILAEFLPDDFFTGIDGFVPVPLHASRHRKRGYNQSSLLARGIVENHPGLPLLERPLVRTRKTATQTALDRDARRHNMKGAFGVLPNHHTSIAGKRLMLLDDVVTTGATTAAAVKTLLDAGCVAVKVLAIARD
jgi:ComF family protein